MAPNQPYGRMTLRRNAPGDGQKPRIKLWTLDTPKEGTTADKLLKHYLRVFENVDRWDAKKAELKTNPDLTDIGRNRAALDFGFGTVMPDNLKARRTLRKAAQEVATRRSKLQQPKSDPTDLAAALRRQELRSIMRSMDTKARDAFLRQNGLLTGLDPEIRQAVTEMPASVSGVSESVRDDLLREAMESVNAPALAEINELERAIEIAASALEEGRNEIQREAIAVDPGYADPDRFEARAVEAAKLTDQPWLKVHNENGAEILKMLEWDEATNSGSWRIPTNEQIENGIVAETKDEYEKLKVAAPLGAFGTGDEGRKARAEFVNQHGIEAYLNRGKAA
jgi:hypothetical protein